MKEANVTEVDFVGNTETAEGKDTLNTVSETQEQFQPNPLTRREMKYLKRSRYLETKDSPQYKTFVLFNKKTGQMVELNAASSFHACKTIGWKPNQVRVIAQKEIAIETPETVGTSSINGN